MPKTKKNKKEELSLTLFQIVRIWEALNDVVDINVKLKPEFTVPLKRCRALFLPEVKFWNSLTGEEKKLSHEETVEFTLSKIKASVLPEVIPDDLIGDLSLIVDGEIPKQKSKFEQKLKNKVKKDGKA